MIRKSPEWERIFVNYIHFIEFNIQNIWRAQKKKRKEKTIHSKVRTWRENFQKQKKYWVRNISKYLISVEIEAMKIWTTVRFHLTLVRMAKINKTVDKKYQRACVGKGTKALFYIDEWQICTAIMKISVENFLEAKDQSTIIPSYTIS